MNLIVKLPPVRLTDINTDGTDKKGANKTSTLRSQKTEG